MRSHARPAADEIGMRRKVLFYLSRWWFVVGRCCADALLADHRRPTNNGQRTTANDCLYPGLSRCTTFTRYPAFRKRLLTSSAIITERCWPPVQPKEMVR